MVNSETTSTTEIDFLSMQFSPVREDFLEEEIRREESGEALNANPVIMTPKM